MDRNYGRTLKEVQAKVALRKESVDRNAVQPGSNQPQPVALRKESVDRNFQGPPGLRVKMRRSPQGERG